MLIWLLFFENKGVGGGRLWVVSWWSIIFLYLFSFGYIVIGWVVVLVILIWWVICIFIGFWVSLWLSCKFDKLGEVSENGFEFEELVLVDFLWRLEWLVVFWIRFECFFWRIFCGLELGVGSLLLVIVVVIVEFVNFKVLGLLIEVWKCDCWLRWEGLSWLLDGCWCERVIGSWLDILGCGMVCNVLWWVFGFCLVFEFVLDFIVVFGVFIWVFVFLILILFDWLRVFGFGFFEVIWILCFGIKVGCVDYNYLWFIEYGVRWCKGKLFWVVFNMMEVKVVVVYWGEFLGVNL